MKYYISYQTISLLKMDICALTLFFILYLNFVNSSPTEIPTITTTQTPLAEDEIEKIAELVIKNPVSDSSNRSNSFVTEVAEFSTTSSVETTVASLQKATNNSSYINVYPRWLICDNKTERFSECVSQCPKSCENTDPKPCNNACYKGCQCAPGYVKNYHWKCIPESECPTCPENEHFRDCGSNCETTCDNYQNFPSFCDHKPGQSTSIGFCRRGCFCNYGFVRDLEKNGTCVPIDKCPKRCGENEYWDIHGEPCIRTADDPHPKCLFSNMKPGCVCNTGFIRDKTTKKCISKTMNLIESNCGQNETYSYCGSDCALNCFDTLDRKKCVTLCNRGCFCKEGYVRSFTNNCILPQDCIKPRQNWLDPLPIDFQDDNP